MIIIGTRTELCIYIQVTKDIILIGRLLKNEQQPTSSIGTCDSVRADNRYDWISADISIIGLLSVLLISKILSVSADKQPYIGDLSDMLNYMWP